ncbi:MAG: ABC transporter permease [Alphaproteobacteria bacterium]|nr:ABC transporter permease [Alphaproteobacteria bacterium]
MNAVFTIAAREIREGVRNRWVLATTLVLAALALTLAFLGSTPAGTVKASALAVTVVSLSSLSIFLLPLIAMILTFDGIAGEAERGTLLLLLSYPVARWQIVLGKFLGHTAILAFATLVGYGATGLVVGLSQDGGGGWAPYLAMVGSSILLGAAFAAIGTLVSALARERAVAGGLGIGLWLFFVIVFDMALLGILAADTNQTIGPATVPWLLMLNPADIYRFFNLASFGDVSTFAGLAGLSESVRIAPPAMLGALVVWIVAPLGLAALAFQRRSL